MKISGKCKIATKYQQEGFDFENKGKLSVGRLCWSDVKKDKDGGKPTFQTTTKKFICFGEVARFIEANLGKSLEIKGTLKGESFTNQQGEVIKFDQIVVEEATLFEKKDDTSDWRKSLPSNQQQEDASDFIPF